MESPVYPRLRTAVAALALAILAGCAGNAPRAQAPLEAAGTAVAADHASEHGPGAIDDASPAADVAGTDAATLDPGASSAAADGSDPAALGDGADATAPGYDPTQAELDFAAIYGGEVY